MEKKPLLGVSASHAVNSGSFDSTAKCDIHFADVTLSVKDRKLGHKDILNGCSGSVEAGELTAIIGPSGAGKTSLLNVLAGRTRKGLKSDSKILLNGLPINEADSSGQIAYVTQEDSIYAHATVRESLMFSANLRLPTSISKEEKRKRVDDLIKQLRLGKCAESLVGSELKRGISGGEKKRTSIGIELITDPSILFLDEPTSGLDSFAALKVVEILRHLSRQGCVVLCTIHQPSSEVFSLFDKVLLMAQGHIMYGGTVKMLPNHFESLGHPCPPNHNVADHVLFQLQTLDEDQFHKAMSAWNSSSQVAIADIADLKSHLRRRQPKKHTTGCFRQAGLLFYRELTGTLRNRGQLYARYGMTVFLNLLYALIFKGAAQWVDGNGEEKDIVSHFGAVTQVVISAMFAASQPIMLEFPLERPIFIREYATAHYGAIPYFISKTLIEMPLTFIQNSLAFLITYWLMGFNGSIIYMIILAWSLSIVAASISLTLGCALTRVKVAMQLSTLAFVPQLLFAGFFIKINQIPVFLRWVQYMCSLKFAINLFMLVEFNEACKVDTLLKEGVHPDVAVSIHSKCQGLLQENNVHEDDWLFYVGVLAGIFVFFRTVAMLFLKAKARA